MIAFGGMYGKVGFLDCSTMSFVSMLDAHQTEIAAIYFHDKEYQMITITIEGEISLWDAQKKSVLQTVRTKNFQPIKQLSSTTFYA